MKPDRPADNAIVARLLTRSLRSRLIGAGFWVGERPTRLSRDQRERVKKRATTEFSDTTGKT